MLLGGLGASRAKRLATAIDAAIQRAQARQRAARAVADFERWASSVLRWVAETRQSCEAQFGAKGWLDSEFIAAATRDQPRDLEHLLAMPAVQKFIEGQDSALRDALRYWEQPLEHTARALNQQHLHKVRVEDRQFLDRVEKAPLNPEQEHAVACLDNRVLLVASAGSGKTSTMVAKAGYVLRHGYFVPNRILLLAFNADAAEELGERVCARLGPLGLPAQEVRASTFHAFGLDVIGRATGRRPSIATWLDAGKDLDALLEMVDALKDRDPAFRMKWDLFRVVFSHDLPSFGKEQEGGDAWDRERKREGFWTLNNEVVKSCGELLLANWLFYNGVRYAYEAPYEYDTADATHRQYQPDFYFPEAKAYLEHWALDEQGEPPATFVGYKEGMAWKRAVHARHGTRLLETTMAGIWSGEAFRYLAAQLSALGIQLDPNPDRQPRGRPPIENRRLAGVFRSFMVHVKSNRLDMGQLREALRDGAAGNFSYRHAMFLDLFEPIHAAWESRLREERSIDFEDMLNQAADCIEQGLWESPYELVMVDEFQDASRARARLVKGLVAKPGRYLFAVGDDWQSINRFAGADLSVMTDFLGQFGRGTVLKLEQTHRCPQNLCDVSRKFVQKNPGQLRKLVQSRVQGVPNPVRILRVKDESSIQAGVARAISMIGATDPAKGPPRVLILGRYRADRKYVPPSGAWATAEATFLTVHASKGLEADHVIVLRMTSETLGFPSRVEDDPVLGLAMPREEAFEHAEERRLFYVALTRARSTVTLITLDGKESSFIKELIADWGMSIENLQGAESTERLCPSCGKAFLRARLGKWGPFLGCGSYPRCEYTEKLREKPIATATGH